MTLTPFPEQTVVFAENQPEYLPFPAHRFTGDASGRVAACWKLSWAERLTVLWRGRIWQEILTFNQPLQPQKLSTTKPEMP